MGLENKVAVIAGATGGLGYVVTQRLAQLGMRVALLASDAARLEALVKDRELAPGRYLTCALEVQDRDAVFAAARQVQETFGRVDALFNFVGGWIGGKTLVELTPDDLTGMLTQHVWTTFHLTQAFLPPMLANGWGRLATVSPPNSLVPAAKRAAYAAGKAAQEALMLGLAQELRGTGVTANVLVVNAIDALHERDAAPSPKTALWTTPEEIAAMLVYLLSAEAHVVNGQRLVLYGG